MILLPGLLFILWGEPGRCLEETGGFTLDGDIRHFAVANNTVYIATEERLYQLSHDLTLVQSLTQRGVLTVGRLQRNFQRQHFIAAGEGRGSDQLRCGRVRLLRSAGPEEHLSCAVQGAHPGGIRGRSSASVGFLVDVKQSRTETYILTANQQHKTTTSSCILSPDTVNLYNTNDDQKGSIFTKIGEHDSPSIKQNEGNVEFVDGFQINLTIYLFSNIPSSDKNNKVRLIWLESKTNKRETLGSLRGATLSISDGDEDSRLVASAVIPGGPPVLWSGVFSVDGGQTNTQLVLFDISPDLSGQADDDPDFYSVSNDKTKRKLKTLKPKIVLFRQNYMTSVLAVRQKAWMVFFIGTGDGQLIRLAVDQNYHTTCPRVLYRANDDRRVFPKMLLDQVDLKHVYVPLQNQMKRVPVSNCSTYTNVQDCWSAQDPYCVWCGSRKSCTFEDDCKDSDWISIPDGSQPKMVSYKVAKDSTGQITLNIQTHLTVGQKALSKFACQFSATSIELCSTRSPPPLFPQCTCVFSISTLPAEGLPVTVKFRLGTTILKEQLKLSNCSEIKGPPTSVLCRQCIEAGCGWSKSGCSWTNGGVEDDNICQMNESGMNFFKPEISSITPSVVSFYGRNHAVLSGYNLSDVTRVRIQADMDCTPQESPVWNNAGVTLKFHIPSTDNKGTVKVCVLLPDGSCHGNAKITYKSSPSCTNIVPSSSWISGKRKVTVMGSHVEFVEGVMHSHALREVRAPRNINYQNLTYDTPEADKKISTSTVFLKVANETLACSTTLKYYPDPEFTSFTSTRTGDDVRITIQKKADKLEMTLAELSVWGVEEGKEYPCIMQDKETSNEMDFFICEIERTPKAKFQQLMIKYGDKTVTLNLSSSFHLYLLLALLLIPCIIIVVLIVYRSQQKKLTATMNKRMEDLVLDIRNDIRQGPSSEAQLL
ncbi:plexin-C1-like [Anoplopoma fimbria]|uniref:plexin-C1-like n=1 Tax=Anoplopoma fimbria TaxID=229290 RepID=UPI0023EDB758|nr:plexin-C1-like [Anoplopoma fimbria]